MKSILALGFALTMLLSTVTTMFADGPAGCNKFVYPDIPPRCERFIP